MACWTRSCLMRAIMACRVKWSCRGALAAKAAQAQLLQRADFQLDADIAAQSQRTAQRLFRECSGRLLGT